jgi:hypothetical protein
MQRGWSAGLHLIRWQLLLLVLLPWFYLVRTQSLHLRQVRLLLPLPQLGLRPLSPVLLLLPRLHPARTHRAPCLLVRLLLLHRR